MIQQILFFQDQALRGLRDLLCLWLPGKEHGRPGQGPLLRDVLRSPSSAEDLVPGR